MYSTFLILYEQKIKLENEIHWQENDTNGGGVRQKNSSTVNCVNERASPIELRITTVYDPVSSGNASLINKAV